MVEQPSGTVTLVFTDIEGSTRLLRELGQDAYREALALHRRVVREACVRQAGFEVDCEGDSFFYAFQSAQVAIAAVSGAMAELEKGPIRIRVGVHSGEPGLDPPKYVGLDVHLAARMMAAAHGGQVVLSQSTRELLGELFPLRDLGEHRLKDLSEPRRLYQLGQAEFPPLRTLYRSNLPVPATAFLGRERELAELTDLLRGGVRLLTLTGPGGTGKTRLGLQAAAEGADGFPDGVWWLALAPLRDPAFLLPAVAQALAVREEPGVELAETLTAFLAGKRLLLLLDNAEHLLPLAADAIAKLRQADGPTLLVTSRERLQLAGERVYAVPALASADGLELFVTRAVELGSDVADTAAVAELCSRLDNLPLAIELSAARTVVLSPAEILERLAQRLDLFRGGRDADPRQRTLRATIEWSYDLLTPGEQELFARLAVFTGGWTLEAAEQVCDADPETLGSLVDKNLIRRRDERFRMLETIHEFAAERLDDETCLRHADWFLALAEQAEPELMGSAQAVWLGRLDAEHDNLRAALVFLRRSGRSALEVRLAGTLWRFWHLRGFLNEGQNRLDEILAAAGSDRAVEHEKILYGAAVLAHRRGDYDRAEQLAAEHLAMSRARADPKLIASSLLCLGVMVVSKGEYERALALWTESADLARKQGDKNVLAMTIGNIGDLALQQGDYETARSRFEESLALFREISDTRGIAGTLANLGRLAHAQGRSEEAKGLVREALELAHGLGDKEVITWCLVSLGEQAASEGRADRAARLLGASDALREDTGHAQQPSEKKQLERIMVLLGAELDQGHLASARAEGHAMTLDEAVAYALEPAD